MKIALIGYGGVGAAFVKLLNEKKEYINKEGAQIQINYILNSRGGVYNPDGITSSSHLVDFFEKEITFDTIIKNKDVDLIVELTPTNKETGQPGMDHITKALENGMHVVTGNKGPILLNYKKLNDLAVKNHVELCIGCTTGGALPSINGGVMDLAGSNILSIEGVLNGTTNFILNEMEANGGTYSETLKKAQEMGIAETDPTLDVEGWDTASKLLILTNVLMNQDKTLKDMNVEGITQITPEEIERCIEENKKYKLVGKTTCENGNVNMSVRLQKLSKDHPLYNVDGKNKGVTYTSDTLGDLTIIGGASGVTPAAASILRDVINIHRGYKFSR